MAYENRPNPFNPLIVGAIAVIVALVAFLVFREADTTQQAGVESPPAATSPGAPTTPAPANNQPSPKGSGNL